MYCPLISHSGPLSTNFSSPTPPPPFQSTPHGTPTDSSDRERSSDSTGAIVGAVVGLLLVAGLVLALALVLLFVLLFVLHRRKMNSVKEDCNDAAPMDDHPCTG